MNTSYIKNSIKIALIIYFFTPFLVLASINEPEEYPFAVKGYSEYPNDKDKPFLIYTIDPIDDEQIYYEYVMLNDNVIVTCHTLSLAKRYKTMENISIPAEFSIISDDSNLNFQGQYTTYGGGYWRYYTIYDKYFAKNFEKLIGELKNGKVLVITAHSKNNIEKVTVNSNKFNDAYYKLNCD